MQRIAVLNNGDKVGAHMLPTELLRPGSSPAFVKPSSSEEIEPLPIFALNRSLEIDPVHSDDPRGDTFPFADKDSIISMEELDRRSISRAISLCGSDQVAANRLGISPATIYRKIKLYGIENH